MANGNTNYPNFSIVLSLAAPSDRARPIGGFSEVSGLSMEIGVTEYRDGEERLGLQKTTDVVLKRGLVNSAALFAWIDQARAGETWVASDATIVLRDEANKPAQTWKLSNAKPIKYTGPPLSGKGGGDVAMEELVLSAERIKITLD
jgi:phage tail-like protein